MTEQYYCQNCGNKENFHYMDTVTDVRKVFINPVTGDEISSHFICNIDSDAGPVECTECEALVNKIEVLSHV